MFRKIHPVMRKSLYVFILITVAAIASVTSSEIYMDDAWEEQQSAKRAMRLWKNKIDGSAQSNRIIDEYENSYLSLVRRGVIGEENRLNWFETIQATSESRGMPSVRYSISSQEKLGDKKYKSEFSGIDVYRSPMTLDITMGHEGDLFAILNNLESRALGLYAVDKCDVERYSNKSDDDITDNMKAYCELSWYTIRSADEGTGT